VVKIAFCVNSFFGVCRKFELYGRGEKPVIRLMSDPFSGNWVDVSNHKGTIVARLGAPYTKDPIAPTDPTDRTGGRLDISDGAGDPKLLLFVGPFGRGWIEVRNDDDQGRSANVEISCDVWGGRIRINRSSRLGNPLTGAVTIDVMPNGSGSIYTTDSSGSIIWTSPLR